MSKRKEITSYFQPKKKQPIFESEAQPIPTAASVRVTGDGDHGVEPQIFGGANNNSEQHDVNRGTNSDNIDESID